MGKLQLIRTPFSPFGKQRSDSSFSISKYLDHESYQPGHCQKENGGLEKKLPRVCVIGAGPSGLVASKVLKERGIPFRCYEKGSDVGGLWRFENDSGLSAAYESLHINSSRQLMAFSDFPMRADLPDFPHHSQILEYLEEYASHFELREETSFQSQVERVKSMGPAGFEVNIRSRSGDEHVEGFDAVIVANGHHWSPRIPQLEGEFDGQILHSHQFKRSGPFAGKNVLVVGIGNSGVDIACELSRVAKKTLLSTRRGAHVIPKYLLGKPLDRVASRHFWTHCPLWLRQKLFSLLLRLTRGRQSRYGLPEPDYKVLQEHPTVSSEMLNLLGHGKIRIKPDISCLEGNGVRFADQSFESIDTVILATGYDIRFPFLDSGVIRTTGNEVPLYKRVIHPEQKGLFFAGLIQPWGPLMPLAEIQSEWIGDLLEQKARLPAPEQMRLAIRKERATLSRRYVKSSRHTIQVDYFPYLLDIQRQRKRNRGEPALDESRIRSPQQSGDSRKVA
ncbi:MAG: NAD(P)-binding domain-containing protein [Planctomycetota bacterium]|nr:NAD(P)-binding domain-containing protein [Planctomycetota bacterium]